MSSPTATAAIAQPKEGETDKERKAREKAERKREWELKNAGKKQGGKGGKPKLTKAERRAKQAAQRAAKGLHPSEGKGGKGGKGGKQGGKDDGQHGDGGKDSSHSSDAHRGSKKGSGGGSHHGHMQFDDPKKVAKYNKDGVLNRTASQKQFELFSHLPQFERNTSLSLQVGFSNNELHPAIVRTGLWYAEGRLTGGNARTVAMLQAFKAWVKDYKTPPQTLMSRDMQTKVKRMFRFLIDCRPHSFAMGNALRYFKMRISKLPVDQSEDDAKASLADAIDDYLLHRIHYADKAIAGHCVQKIKDGDVILTYAKSHVVEMLLKLAYDQGIKFSVIVADSRPKLEGKVLLKRLVDHGIRCTYILVSAVSYVMPEVSKVVVGAAAMLSNGHCLSRVGTALVGMHARNNNVPFIVCCETYKFHERVLLDSLCWNELGDPDDLVMVDREEDEEEFMERHADKLREALQEGGREDKAMEKVKRLFGHGLRDWRDHKELRLLNLVYDVTPTDFISMVVTEVGVIPPTAVPAILREFQRDE